MSKKLLQTFRKGLSEISGQAFFQKACIAAFIVLASIVFTTSAFSWGSAAHLYIAKRVNEELQLYRWDYLKFPYMYGAMASDIHNLAPDEIRTDLRCATHHLACDNSAGYQAVVDEARWWSQKAFAAGFETHNEDWAADYYAHLDPGYVRDWKNDFLANLLTGIPGIDPSMLESAAEIYLEAGIDLLLENEDSYLGREVKKAALLRSWTIPSLLARAYPEFVGEGLLVAEGTFRSYLYTYGGIIALPTGQDKEAMANSIADLAAEQYGIELDPDLSLMFLDTAMGLCIKPGEKDYATAIEENIESIIDHLEFSGAPPKPAAKPFAATAWGEIKKAH